VVGASRSEVGRKSSSRARQIETWQFRRPGGTHRATAKTFLSSFKVPKKIDFFRDQMADGLHSARYSGATVRKILLGTF